MTTIPARLAQTTRVSRNPSERRMRVIDLYRDWIRAAPEVCTLYAINVSPQEIRHAIRQRFEQHRYVSDPRAIDVLLLKSQQDLQETLNCWKQTDHVLGILLETKQRPQKSFMQKFLEGRDEDAITPAASGVV